VKCGVKSVVLFDRSVLLFFDARAAFLRPLVDSQLVIYAVVAFVFCLARFSYRINDKKKKEDDEDDDDSETLIEKARHMMSMLQVRVKTCVCAVDELLVDAPSLSYDSRHGCTDDAL